MMSGKNINYDMNLHQFNFSKGTLYLIFYLHVYQSNYTYGAWKGDNDVLLTKEGICCLS
jgi:hypothetical protein